MNRVDAAGKAEEKSGLRPYYSEGGISIYHGDCREVLSQLPEASVQCCVTSPPYFGLRDYGVVGQIGLEPTPDIYVGKLVEVFREVRRVLADDGTLWLNLGDSYASGGRKSLDPGQSKIHPAFEGDSYADGLRPDDPLGIKPKDLLGIPWSVAFALRADGWYLRQDIIWHKPNPMPESVEDRCTKAHEYMFLLSKSEQYFFDAAAIAEPIAEGSAERYEYAFGGKKAEASRVESESGLTLRTRPVGMRDIPTTRNRRSVWTIPVRPFPGAHFATFPPDLIEPCIKAGSRPGDTVLDPFNGSGTTGHVSQKWGRRYIGIELNPNYIELTKERFRQKVLFGAEVA